jgi:hypothetical protein
MIKRMLDQKEKTNKNKQKHTIGMQKANSISAFVPNTQHNKTQHTKHTHTTLRV